MKKFNLSNLYESHLPPTDTSVLWVQRCYKTGDIISIARYVKGKWEPYLVSVEYMRPEEIEDNKQLKED